MTVDLHHAILGFIQEFRESGYELENKETMLECIRVILQSDLETCLD